MDLQAHTSTSASHRPSSPQVVTPDLKLGDGGALVHVDLGAGRRRMGGSALAQAYGQLGDSSPDVAAAHLKGMWEVTQGLLAAGTVSAGHDISDGGIATTVLEMAFAGGCCSAACLFGHGAGVWMCVSEMCGVVSPHPRMPPIAPRPGGSHARRHI
jgi:hypothetical protein